MTIHGAELFDRQARVAFVVAVLTLLLGASLAAQALDQQESDEEYVMAGETHLLGGATAEEMDRLRELFDAFERKKDLLHLLEKVG